MIRFVFSEHPELARHFLLSQPFILSKRIDAAGVVLYCSPELPPPYRYRFKKLYYDGKEGTYQYFLTKYEMEFLERFYPEVFL